MSGKFLSKAILFSLVIGANAFSGGVSAANVYELAPVVVTATKTAESLEKVPASVSVVTAKDIEDHNYSSTAQALGQLPGIYLSPVADGGISMRGFVSADILVMVDGQPVNNGWNGSVDWGMIPVQNIERIEVVRGAASSLYGGRAVGGVIQITTKENKEDGLHGDVLLSTGSNSTTKQVYDAKIKKDKWDVNVGYEKRKTDGWRGYFIEERPGYNDISDPTVDADVGTSARDRYIVGGRGRKAIDSESYHVKTTYHFNEDKKLTYSYFHTNYNYAYNDPFSFIKDKDGKEIFYGHVNLPNGKYFDIYPGDFLGYVGQKEWAVHNLAYDDDKNQFHARIGLTDIKKDGYSSTGGPEESISAGDLQKWNGDGSQSFYPSKTKDFDMHKTWELGQHTLLAGMAYRSESFDQTRYKLTNWRNHDGPKSAYELHGGKDESWSGYLQDKWQANNRLAVYAGVRFDRYKKYDGYGSYLDSGVSRTYAEGTYTEWSPKFSLEYALPNDTTLFASYGHSFTPPILSNVYRDEGAKIQNVNGQLTVAKKGSLANPDLKPETSDTYEIGVKKKWGDKTFASVSLYKAETKDAIEYYSTTKATIMNGVLYKKGFSQYRNLGDASKKGVEVEAKHKFNDKWSTYVNYAWESEDIDGEHNYNVPKHLVHFGVEYNYNKWDILADAQYVSARQTPDVESGKYQSEDSFFITNMAFNYNVTPEAKLQFTIYNLFDKTFYAGEAASERLYTFSLQYKF